jgi:hypothetical protein
MLLKATASQAVRSSSSSRSSARLCGTSDHDATIHGVSKVGRNDPCPCGSGRKAKRCCGVQRGPSEGQLARALLAQRGREAAFELADAAEGELEDLWEALDDLPTRDLSLQVRLPELISPDLQRLCEAIEDDEPDEDALEAAVKLIDTSVQRQRLADAVVELREAGRLSRREAAAALLDLDSPSTWFIEASLLEAVAVSVGVSETPGGLRIAA